MPSFSAMILTAAAAGSSYAALEAYGAPAPPAYGVPAPPAYSQSSSSAPVYHAPEQTYAPKQPEKYTTTSATYGLPSQTYGYESASTSCTEEEEKKSSSTFVPWYTNQETTQLASYFTLHSTISIDTSSYATTTSTKVPYYPETTATTSSSVEVPYYTPKVPYYPESSSSSSSSQSKTTPYYTKPYASVPYDSISTSTMPNKYETIVGVTQEYTTLCDKTDTVTYGGNTKYSTYSTISTATTVYYTTVTGSVNVSYYPKETYSYSTSEYYETTPVKETYPAEKTYPQETYSAKETTSVYEHKTYPSETYPVETHPAETYPAKETYQQTWSTEEQKTYPAKETTSVYEHKTYPAESTPVYETKSYPAETYPAETYPAKETVPAQKTYEQTWSTEEQKTYQQTWSTETGKTRYVTAATTVTICSTCEKPSESASWSAPAYTAPVQEYKPSGSASEAYPVMSKEVPAPSPPAYKPQESAPASAPVMENKPSPSASHAYPAVPKESWVPAPTYAASSATATTTKQVTIVPVPATEYHDVKPTGMATYPGAASPTDSYGYPKSSNGTYGNSTKPWNSPESYTGGASANTFSIAALTIALFGAAFAL